MKAEENKQQVQRLLDRVLNEHELDVLDQLVSADYVEHEPYPGHQGNRKGLEQWYGTILEAFPDLRWNLELQVAESDRVVSFGTTKGTHTGRFSDFAPSGRKVITSWVISHRLADGKVVEGRHYPDTLSVWQQIGQVPPPGGRRPEQ